MITKGSADNLGKVQGPVGQAMATISGVVAAALVDLRTGEFLDLDSTGGHPKEFVAYLATTTASYFEGDAVRTIATVLDEATPEQRVERRIDEIIMRSSGFLHVMVRLDDSLDPGMELPNPSSAS